MKRNPIVRVSVRLVIAGALILMSITPRSPAVAAHSVTSLIPSKIYPVNSPSDGPDVNIGDQKCDDGTGNCTLRAAIQEANSTPDLDEIDFAIPVPPPPALPAGSTCTYPGGVLPVSGNVAICPSYTLPTISQPLIINGTTQTGYSAVPLIELDGLHGNGGGGVGPGVDGFLVTAPGSTIEGLWIHSFTRHGIDLRSSGNVVVANYIGEMTTSSVDAYFPNACDGVFIDNGANNTIGMTGNANVISGNGVSALPCGATMANGVEISGASAGANVITGNYIGTDPSGVIDRGNYKLGVRVADAPNVTIGGTSVGARNVISGNNGGGIEISGAGASGAHIQGNLIGTKADGLTGLGNGSNGISVIGTANTTIGGISAGAGNVISKNGTGISLAGGANLTVIQGNLIGTDINGTVGLGNSSGGGVSISVSPNNTVGGTVAGARNVIAGNAGRGISISGASASGNQIQGNYVGTDVTGTVRLANLSDGINISGAPGNTVGGTVAGARNIISGNGPSSMMTGAGVAIAQTGATGNVVQGNFIGLDVTGTVGIRNSGDGVNIGGAPGNVIGGTVPGAGNVISGNGTSDAVCAPACPNGIEIAGANAKNNSVQGNLIGTDVTGTSTNASLGNWCDAIYINGASQNTIGGTTAAARNVIAASGPWRLPLTGGNYLYQCAYPTGIQVFGSGASQNTIQGNFVGTDISGNVTDPDGIPNSNDEFGNVGEGIYVNLAPSNTVGGSAAGAGNVVSGNGRGITVYGGTASGNVIQGNRIGTNVGGNVMLPNGGDGVFISSAPANVVGGTTPGSGNVISSSRNAVGVEIYDVGSHDNIVQGNNIGTDAGGTVAFSNFADGIWVNGAPNNTIGGADSGAGNLISGNGANGIYLWGSGSTGNLVKGNRIGTTTSGASLGNVLDGVRVSGGSGSSTVGGTEAGAGNVIAFNGGNGVLVDTSTGNGILGNSIHDNVGNLSSNPPTHGLGIDLVTSLLGWGVTDNDPGDADTGGNNYQNFPVLAAAWNSGANTNIYGFLNSTATTTFRVELFSNDACNAPSPPDDHGEGQTYLGFVSVTTNSGGAGQPAGGSAFFNLSVAGSLAGKFITATATDPGNNTSEFSQCVQVTTPPGPDTDADGYRDGLETDMGKNPTVYCGIMRADVNYDGVVSILDLAAVAAQFGQLIPPANPRYDQDADNHISILDLAKQAQVYGQSVWACP